MVWLETKLANDHIVVSHRRQNMSHLEVPFEPREKEVEVEIWGVRCQASLVSREADRWFSSALDIDCQLVYMPNSSQRKIKQKYLTEIDLADPIVSFADGMPFLMIGDASMEELNRRLDVPMTVHPFRPNFTFSGGTPHCEDSWTRVQIGKVRFLCAVNWARCPVPTVNQESASFSKEPLRTLALYRRHDQEVFFGKSLLLDGPEGSQVRVGDTLLVET